MKLIFGKIIANYSSFLGEISTAKLLWNISTSEIRSFYCAQGKYYENEIWDVNIIISLFIYRMPVLLLAAIA